MMFLERNSFASDVIWTANEFGSAFDVDEFEVNFVVVFQTHVHAFSTTTPTETSFCRAAFYFWKL